MEVIWVIESLKIIIRDGSGILPQGGDKPIMGRIKQFRDSVDRNDGSNPTSKQLAVYKAVKSDIVPTLCDSSGPPGALSRLII